MSGPEGVELRYDSGYVMELGTRCWFLETATLTWLNHRDTPAARKLRPLFCQWDWRTCQPLYSYSAEHGSKTEGPGACLYGKYNSYPRRTKSWIHTVIYSITYPHGIRGITPNSSWSYDASRAPPRESTYSI